MGNDLPHASDTAMQPNNTIVNFFISSPIPFPRHYYIDTLGMEKKGDAFYIHALWGDGGFIKTTHANMSKTNCSVSHFPAQRKREI